MKSNHPKFTDFNLKILKQIHFIFQFVCHLKINNRLTKVNFNIPLTATVIMSLEI